jgi:prepilin peptidase CpaA
MMEITASEALWFLPPVLPIAILIAYNDLKYMKIINNSLYVLGVVFLIAGLIALPFETYLWRLAQFLVVLIIGFGANALHLVGGGDAKYAAAIAPFVAYGDGRVVLMLFAAMLLAAFATHRLFGSIGSVRRLTAGWASWEAGKKKGGKKFPMGLALSGTLIVYLVLPLLG